MDHSKIDALRAGAVPAAIYPIDGPPVLAFDGATMGVCGPVLTAMRFTSEDDVIRLANGTPNVRRAHGMVRVVRTGVVYVNTCGGADGTVPPVGVGQSGNGWDKSLHAIDGYINLNTAGIKH